MRWAGQVQKKNAKFEEMGENMANECDQRLTKWAGLHQNKWWYCKYAQVWENDTVMKALLSDQQRILHWGVWMRTRELRASRELDDTLCDSTVDVLRMFSVAHQSQVITGDGGIALTGHSVSYNARR